MRGNEGKCWIKGTEEGKRPLKGGDKQQEKKCSDKFNKTAMPCLVMLPYRRKTLGSNLLVG